MNLKYYVSFTEDSTQMESNRVVLKDLFSTRLEEICVEVSVKVTSHFKLKFKY